MCQVLEAAVFDIGLLRAEVARLQADIEFIRDAVRVIGLHMGIEMGQRGRRGG